ncbi:MAG TPA: PDZ domain-containing protein [Polyangiaceae bacterium]
MLLLIDVRELFRGLTGISRHSLSCVFSLVLCSCGLFYPIVSTPLRGAVPVDQYKPPPSKDVVFVAIASAHIPTKTRDGRSWDKGAGAAPDAYALLFIDEQEVLRTEVQPNSFHPVWSAATTFNLKVRQSSKVRLEVWDDNALVSHPICNEVVRDLPDAASVGTLEVECESGARATLIVEPPKARLGIGLFYELRGKAAFVWRVVAESAAGRAGLKAGDQILSAQGRPVSSMGSGELESIFNGDARGGIELEIRTTVGEHRKLRVRDEPMYPVKGEDIELAAPNK